jgi:chromosome segregation ATPase
MSAMINALQNCRALLLTKNAEIKELEAKMQRLSSAQSSSGTETMAAMAARKNAQEELELLAQALQTAEASQAAVGQELQEEIARSRSLRQEAADKIAGLEKERVEERVKLQVSVVGLF